MLSGTAEGSLCTTVYEGSLCTTVYEGPLCTAVYNAGVRYDTAVDPGSDGQDAEHPGDRVHRSRSQAGDGEERLRPAPRQRREYGPVLPSQGTYLSIYLSVYLSSNLSFIHLMQGQDSRLKMRTFLKPASLGYGVNKHNTSWVKGGVEESEEGEGAD